MSENEGPWPMPIDLGGSERHSWIPLGASPDGILSLDAGGYIINCNEGVCRLLGFTASELREQSFCEFPDVLAPPLGLLDHAVWVPHGIGCEFFGIVVVVG